jgi:RHS repeat-associated protein
VKLQKQTFDNSDQTTNTHDYIGGIEYQGNVLEAIYTDEGRAKPFGTAYRYEYTIKDHLGNSRVMFCDIDNDGIVTESEIIQEEHYYPFGMRHEGYGRTITQGENFYQYNGKELNEDFGLDMYDYGARFYDASVGRWFAIDPLAEKYVGFSPYNYVMNNPIMFVDPDGRYVDFGKHERSKELWDKMYSTADDETRGSMDAMLNNEDITFTINYTIGEAYYGGMSSTRRGLGKVKNKKEGKKTYGVSVNIQITEEQHGGKNINEQAVAIMGDELTHVGQLLDGEMGLFSESTPGNPTNTNGYDYQDEVDSKEGSIQALKNVFGEENIDQSVSRVVGSANDYYEKVTKGGMSGQDWIKSHEFYSENMGDGLNKRLSGTQRTATENIKDFKNLNNYLHYDNGELKTRF